MDKKLSTPTTLSFLRKQESMAVRFCEWIPAFAGMTDRLVLRPYTTLNLSIVPVKKTILLFIATIISFYSINAIAAKSRNSPLRSFGDYAQIINPVIAGGLASQEKGVGHFAVIYGQSLLTTHSIKFVANKNKWGASKRPSIEDKKDRYEGMPSGHTNSAWLAASYIRTFSEDHKYLSIPLYITATATAYSRIHAKEHTTAQVIAGAALAEIVTFINSKLKWSNDYSSNSFYFGGDEVGASFVFKF